MAVELYSEMLRAHKHNPGILFNRSLAYSQNGDHELAIEDLRQAILYLSMLFSSSMSSWLVRTV